MKIKPEMGIFRFRTTHGGSKKEINQTFHKIITMQKGISPVIAMVLVILVSVVSITIVLTVALPLIDKFNDASYINAAQTNMGIIDNLIREVASEGFGIVKSALISSSAGVYRTNEESESFEYDLDLKSDILRKGTFMKEGNLVTIIAGTASASQNTTHLKIENEILEVVFDRNGNRTSFDGVNTSSIVRTMRLKDSSTTLVPTDTSVIIEGYRNSSWGLGYSELVEEGISLQRAEVRAHLRSNLTNHEYDVFYTLSGSSDFLSINVRNVSSTNKTTFVFTYRLGSSGSDSDTIRVGEVNETTFTN